MMKKLNNKAYVLVETIVVISVLCVILIALYGAYSSMIINIEKRNLYDNTDYLYRTKFVRDYIENEDSVNFINDKIYCQDDDNPCYTNTCTTEKCNLFRFLNVKGIYIFGWDEKVKYVAGVNASTLRYINSIDATSEDHGTKRLVVMYEEVENGVRKNEYASLKIKLKGE